jgi:hypothetical protein
MVDAFTVPEFRPRHAGVRFGQTPLTYAPEAAVTPTALGGADVRPGSTVILDAPLTGRQAA